MTSPQRITAIFHSALERQGTERQAFLDGACGQDQVLRREVESLIRSHEQAGSLMDSPAYERDAKLFEDMDRTRFEGRTLDHYRIVRKLGGGGMGEVYLAEDLRLGRLVAIKILPRRLTSDPALVARFRQEARAASALNHANIVTIYEVGEAEGTHFIATEFVDGETLRLHLSRKSLNVAASIDIASQVAAALSRAHQQGVVHRDIKPENIMLDAEGHAKVLDFGIAKLTEQAQSGATEAPTVLKVETTPGAVIGTAHYMSPEQARALRDVDARTDVWSLGVVLYEMIAGRQPFDGPTPSDVMSGILNKEPLPLARFNHDVSEALELVVQKALAKDRDDRYQSAKELAADLKRVRQRIDASRTGDSEGRSASATPDTTYSESLRTKEPAQVHTTSSAEYIVNEIKRHKRGMVVALGILGVVVAVIGFALYRYFRPPKPAKPIFESFTVTRITTDGRANEANISPDGRYVVYVEEDDAGNLGILVRQTATGNTLQIVPKTKTRVWAPGFSPDSDFVYYLASDLSSEVNSLYRVPSIGGAQNKVLEDIDTPFTFSPDGRQLAFIREERDVTFDLITANIDGSGERVLTKRHGFDFFEESGPSWSPDGKTIACPGGTADRKTGEVSLQLLGIDVESGAVRELSPKKWFGNASRVVWMPDGASLAVIASDGLNDPTQIWRVAYPSGETNRITNDVQSRYRRSLGVTSDGRTMISVVTQALSRIEVVAQDGTTRQSAAIIKADANRDGFGGVAWLPDGRIVFNSYEGGQANLWVMNSDGGERKRLTSDAFWDGFPAVSPDGRYIVFLSNRARGLTTPQIWRMNSDGSNPIQLTFSEDDNPDISPDGRWVLYSSWAPGAKGLITGETLWRISMDGGTPEQVTDYTVQLAEYSPDGNWIVGIVFDDQVTPKRWRNAIIAASGGKPVKQFDRPNYPEQFVRWTKDGKYLSYIGAPAIPSNIWLQPVSGGEPRKLTDYKTEMIFRHAWSRDGKSLAVVRGSRTTDVVLMHDNR